MTEQYRKQVLALALYYYGAKHYWWPEAIRKAEADLALETASAIIN